MLKLGWMARATDAEVFTGHVKFARELDLDVIDFHIGGMPRDIDFVMKIKMMCVNAGLPVGYLGAGSFVGPLDMREARMEQGRADVDMTALMAVRCSACSRATTGRTRRRSRSTSGVR